MKLKCSSPFGLNKGFVSSERVSAFWGTQVVKANNPMTQKITSGPQKIQTKLIRSVLTPFVDQESHVKKIHFLVIWNLMSLCATCNSIGTSENLNSMSNSSEGCCELITS